MKTQHFYTKLLFQKPTLRQIHWGVLSEPIKKNRVLQQLPCFSENFASVQEPRTCKPFTFNDPINPRIPRFPAADRETI